MFYKITFCKKYPQNFLCKIILQKKYINTCRFFYALLEKYLLSIKFSIKVIYIFSQNI